MGNMPVIVKRLPALLSGLALTWLVIRIPGEYAHASVWLMPTVAACFAFATWFVLMYRDMAQALKPNGSGQRQSRPLCMADALDAVGHVCIGAGILSALIQAISSPAHCSWQLPLAMGVGISAGAKVWQKMPAQSAAGGSRTLPRSTVN
ncbi:hypothetical protein ISP14_16565 [Dyella agri]|uniref:Uncharacterized protein n=1 Tax=Dyella agri TaxID=1926869 RepID=A0ABW8KNG3_9GAMM